MARNESFSGSISLMGHSLGSVILFDILSHQSGAEEEDLDAAAVASPSAEAASPAAIQPDAQLHQNSVGKGGAVDTGEEPRSLEELFMRLGMTQHIETFTK